jgi:hypothetical protein
MEESVPAIDSCNQANPETADVACAMESGVSDLIYDQQYSRFSNLMNYFVEPQEAFDVLSREMAEQGIEGEEHDAIMQRIESDFFPEDSEIGDGMTDAEADADTLKSAGWGSDEDYGYYGEMDESGGWGGLPGNHRVNLHKIEQLIVNSGYRDGEMAAETGNTNTTGNPDSALELWDAYQEEHPDLMGFDHIPDRLHKAYDSGFQAGMGGLEEAFDLQNGYNDINDASGNDYFPNGADSPVVNKVGPSGARQGDNPEQKKMQVAETHKELVYAYRSFLKESATPTQKKKLTENTVSEFKIYDYNDSFDAKGDTLTYKGSLEITAKVAGHDGAPHEVMFSVDVDAEAGLDWETVETPTGWNHRRDTPTYSSSSQAISYDPKVKSVQFTPNAPYYIDSNELTEEEFQKLVDPMTRKQLLNPALYVKAIEPYFNKKAEEMAEEEPDYYEPERGESRW